MAQLPHLSHSTVEDIRTCSLKVFLKKVAQVPQRPGWALVGGNVVHHVTEADDKRDFGIPVESDKLDFATEFEKLTAETEERSGFSRDQFYRSGRRSKDWPNKEDAKWWLQNGPPMVERWRNFKRVSPWNIWLTPVQEPAVEIELLGEHGGVPTKGYVDVVMELPNGELAVVDKKTGATEPKSPSQLVQYGGDLERIFPGIRVRWGAYFLARTGSLTPPVDLAPLARDLDRDYRTAARIISLDLFLASPSMLCGSCSVNASCSSYNPALVSSLGVES